MFLLLMSVLVMPLACIPMIVRQHGRTRQLGMTLLLVAGGALIGYLVLQESSDEAKEYRPVNAPLNVRQATTDQQLQTATPKLTDHNGYVGQKVCGKCHQDEHRSWHSSYHRTMTQIASPDAIQADFDGRELKLGYTTYKIYRKGDEYWVRTQDPEWEIDQPPTQVRNHPNPQMADKRIVMVTGSHNMHMFWISWKHSDEEADQSDLDNNSLWLFPWVYMIKEKEWIPYEDSFIVDPQFGRPPAVWNQTCIACHAVGGQPHHESQEDYFDIEFHSNIADYGISCEACHGPGKRHVEKHQDLLDTNASVELSGAPDESIINPERLEKEEQAQVCGQCHSLFEPNHPESFLQDGLDYQPGTDLTTNRRMIFHENTDPTLLYFNMFWNDGTIRIGGREFQGLSRSECFTKGEMTCLSCHSAHSMERPESQLKKNMNSNQACVQCHQEPEYTTELASHTHHQLDSEGSRCFNCHMPHTSYALMRGIRNHRIVSPRVRTPQKNEQPNACNLCHLDKTLQWTADHLTQWYGQQQVKLDQQNQNIAASLIWLLEGNAVQRTLASWHMTWEPTWETSGTNWRLPFMIQLLNDNYSATRYVTWQSIKKLPEYQKVLLGKGAYEFTSQAPERIAIQQAWMNAWSIGAEKHGLNIPQLLFTPDGKSQLNTEGLRELLKNRDNTAILMSE